MKSGVAGAPPHTSSSAERRPRILYTQYADFPMNFQIQPARRDARTSDLLKCARRESQKKRARTRGRRKKKVQRSRAPCIYLVPRRGGGGSSCRYFWALEKFSRASVETLKILYARNLCVNFQREAPSFFFSPIRLFPLDLLMKVLQSYSKTSLYIITNLAIHQQLLSESDNGVARNSIYNYSIILSLQLEQS